jgi:hypothetical protein
MYMTVGLGMSIENSRMGTLQQLETALTRFPTVSDTPKSGHNIPTRLEIHESARKLFNARLRKENINNLHKTNQPFIRLRSTAPSRARVPLTHLNRENFESETNEE